MPIAIGPFPDRLQDQTDVNAASLIDQDVFKYDSGSGKFVHSTFVSSFNARTGAVSLTSLDVTTALGFTPRDAAATTVNTFNTRSGTVTLTSGDVTTALGFIPVSGPAGSTGQIQYNTGSAFGGSATLINAAGQVGLEGTAIVSTTSLGLTKSGTGNLTGGAFSITRTDSGSSVLGFSLSNTASLSSGTLSQIQGLTASARLTNTGTVSFAQGLQGSASCSSAGVGVITTGEGVRGQFGVLTSGTITTGMGVLGFLLNSGGTVSEANIIQSKMQYVGGTITVLRGLYVGGWTGNPAVTDLDGLLIDSSIDIPAATNKFAIRSLSVSPSLLTGNLTVSGLLKTGSGPVTITDVAGNLTSAAIVAGLGFTPIAGIAWGSITGTLSGQSDLQTALNAKTNLAGGNTFTGNQIFSSVATNITVGTFASLSTATPTTLDMGGSLADTIVATKAKWKLYNDGTFLAGIGISANQMNFFMPPGGSYHFYVNDPGNTTPVPQFVVSAAGALTANSFNGLGITAMSPQSTLTIAAAKEFTVTNALTLSGTDLTTITFPTTSATIARTDAGQTFTGTNAFGIVTASSLNGNTFTTGTYTLTGSAGKVLTFSNTLTLTAVDGSTLAIGGGGTLGSAAYTSSGAYQPIDSDLSIVASIGSALQQLRINAGGTAIEYFTPASSGLTVGTTAIGSGSAGRVLYETSGNVLGEISGATSDGTTLTLVAPVLGTPTSGTLTNVTGLPPAGVVGTAAILGANTFTGVQTFTPAVRTSGVAPYFKINTPADTAQTLNAEFPGIVFGGDASFASVTRQGADGTTYALQREYIFVAPTYGFVGATTITKVATVHITNPPIVGANATFTARYALLLTGAGTAGLPVFRVEAGSGSSFTQINDNGTVVIDSDSGTGTTPLTIKYNGSTVASITYQGLVAGAELNGGSGVVTIGGGGGPTAVNGVNLVSNTALIKFGASVNVGLKYNTTNVLEVNNGTAGQWGSLLCGVRDVGTTTVVNGLTLGHQSSGTPAAGLGVGVLFNLNSSTTADQNAAQIASLWTTATHASRTADLVFYTVNNAAALAEGARLTGVKDFSVVGKISTADPTSGAGPLWKLGTKKTAVAVTISPTDYVEVDIAGVVYKLGIVA